MKMWHFYLLEKRDVLLQDCYKNESRSYFERTFSFQAEWDHVLTKMDNFLWKFFYYWFLKKMRSFWLETWLYLGPNKNDILVCCFRHDKNQIKIALPCRKFFPVTTFWLKRWLNLITKRWLEWLNVEKLRITFFLKNIT